jgi:hypothetical protein
VEDTNVSHNNAFMNEVEINPNMLGVMILDVVGGEVDSAEIVAVDQSAPQQGLCNSISIS